MTIGKRIGDLRRERGYSQEYIGERLGVSRQAVSKWDQNQSAPDTANLIALSELLGVSVEYLTTGKTADPPTAAENPPSAETRGTLGAQKIAGLILLGAGLLSLILGVLLSRALAVLAALLLLIGILCLTVRRHLAAVLAGVILGLILLTLLRGSVFGHKTYTDTVYTETVDTP